MDKVVTMEMEKEEPMIFENVLSLQAGSFGRFQKFLLIISCVNAIINGYLSMEVIFVAGKPNFWCLSNHNTTFTLEESDKNMTMDLSRHLSPNITGFREPRFMNGQGLEKGWTNNSSSNFTNYKNTKDQCFIRTFEREASSMRNDSESKMEKCTAWAYDKSQYMSTIVTEYDLVCDRHMLVPTIKSLTMVGKTLGGISLGFIADRFGRQIVLLACVVALPVCRLIEIFVPSFIIFAIAYLIRCSLLTILYMTFFIYTTELVDPSKRALIGTIAAASYGIGIAILAGMGYLIRERWLLQLINTLPVFILFIFIKLPESPRWLYAKGKKSQGYKSLSKVAGFNKRILPQNLSVKVQTEKTSREGTLCDLCRSGMFIRVSIMGFTWFTVAMVYFALTMNIEDFAGDVYLNTFIMAVIESAGTFCSQFLMSTRLGRRGSAVMLYFISGCAMLSTLAVPLEYPLITTSLALIGRGVICGTFNVMYIFAAELFPTNLRGIGMSVSNASSKFGGTLAPFIWKLAIFHHAIPMSIYGGFCVTAAILCFLLPETSGKALPQTVSDITPTEIKIDETEKN